LPANKKSSNEEIIKDSHWVMLRYVVAKNLISNQRKIECSPEKHAFSVFFDTHVG